VPGQTGMTELALRFAFDPSEKIILIHAGKVEIGQHIHSAFETIVASTLEIDISRVHLSAITTESSPDDGMTVGSLSMQVTGRSLGRAALALRAALYDEASQKLNVDVDDIALDPRTLEVCADGKQCSIFDLPTARKADLKAHATPFDLASCSTIAASILGERQYIQDLTLPDMIYARALRGRQFTPGGTDGVRVINDGGFSALVADTESVLDLAWAQTTSEPGPRDNTYDGPVVNWIKKQSAQTHTSGDTSLIVSTTASSGEGVLQTATRPFILHASIAPSCAIALFQHGALEIWTHSQGIFPLRDTIAAYLGLQNSKVIVRHVPSAGCYGHNAADDAAMDAVLISLQNEGVPVRVAWTRQDDFQYSPAGAAMHVEVEAQLSDDNSISSWQQTIWSCPHGQRPGGGGNINLNAAIEQDSENKSMQVSAPPYSINSFAVTTHLIQDLPVRTSSIRGLGAQMNVVCIEATMDKLADSCDADPLEFRLRQLKDPRACEVLRQLKTLLKNATITLQENEGIGISYSRYKEKAAYAAVAARVRLTDKVELVDIWSVVDAGQIVDHSGALNQIEGGIIQAASWTLCEGILLCDGYIDAAGWDDYPVLGWSEIPEIHTTLVGAQSDLPYLGVGECMVGPASAAIVNAVSKVAGISLADLPLTPEKFLQAAT